MLSGNELREARFAINRYHLNIYCTPVVLSRLTHLNVKADHEGIRLCYGRLGRANMYVPICEKSNLGNAKNVASRTCYTRVPWERPFRRQLHNTVDRPGVLHSQDSLTIDETGFKSIVCQKFNNLSYKYPLQGDLLTERVIRAHSFENVRIDYFKPLSVAPDLENWRKCYECIITCVVTRMVYLYIVSDLSR